MKLKYKIFLFIVVPTILSLLLFGSLSAIITHHRLLNQKTEEAELILDFAAEQLKDSLYFLEMDEIEYTIASLMLNPNIHEVKIYDKNSQLILDRATSIQKGDVTFKHDILITNNYLGQVEISYQTNIIESVASNIISFLAVGIVIIIVSVITGFYVSNYVMKPFSTLINGFEKVSKGNYDNKINLVADEEFMFMVAAFNDMISKLKDSRKSQRNVEEDLVESQKKLKAQIDELERFQRLTIDRELKMVELKKKLKKLQN